MARYFLQISYSGRDFHGWQFQPNFRTVQETVTGKLQVLLPDVTGVTGCGRTDTGVHAQRFFLHYDTDLDGTGRSENLVFKLNRMLPPDVAVQQKIPVEDKAHARYHATEREYRYYISRRKSPMSRDVELWYPHSVNWPTMQQCCGLIRTTANFAAFQRSGSPTGTSLCKVFTCRWEQEGDQLVFIISANRFLRNMVRAIVGTMLEVGRGSLSLQDFGRIIENRDRSKAGKSAKAHGLHLTRVEYPFIIANK